jgi:hypothetical protein
MRTKIEKETIRDFNEYVYDQNSKLELLKKQYGVLISICNNLNYLQKDQEWEFAYELSKGLRVAIRIMEGRVTLLSGEQYLKDLGIEIEQKSKMQGVTK